VGSKVAGSTIVEQLDWSGEKREVGAPKERWWMIRSWDGRLSDYYRNI